MGSWQSRLSRLFTFPAANCIGLDRNLNWDKYAVDQTPSFSNARPPGEDYYYYRSSRLVWSSPRLWQFIGAASVSHCMYVQSAFV